MQKAIAMVLICACAIAYTKFVLGDVPVTASPDMPKSPAALGAIHRFERDKLAADNAYRKAMKVALADEIAGLEQARQAAMKNDQLPDAVKIDAAKKAAQDELAAESKLPAAGAALDARVFSAVWQMTENGARIRYTADGSYHCDKWQPGDVGRWKVIDASSAMLTEPDGSLIRATFTADRRAAVFQYITGGKAGAAAAIVVTKPAG